MAQYDKGSGFLNLIMSKQHRDSPPQQASHIHSEAPAAIHELHLLLYLKKSMTQVAHGTHDANVMFRL